MALETNVTHIDDLVATNPAATDALSQADDHIRLIKSSLKTTFANITGAVTASHTELNVLDGLTASQAELNLLDGLTATTAELNLLDGVTATTAELNVLDGVTASTAELNLLDGVTATTTEINYLDGVTSNIQTQLNNTSSYPVAIRVLTSGNYTIPAGAKAVMVRASGGGGGGAGRGSGGHMYPGSHGGDTTVTNSTLGISVTAKGGQRGNDDESGAGAAARTGSSGGDILYKAGAAGGSTVFAGNNVGDVVGGYDGHPGSLVTKYVTSASAGGEVLTISYGSGGNGYNGTQDGAKGENGYVEIWVW